MSQPLTIPRIYILALMVKGAIMGVTTTLIDISFWRSLVLIIVSAVVTGSFALVVAYIQTRHERIIDNRLKKLEQQGDETQQARENAQ